MHMAPSLSKLIVTRILFCSCTCWFQEDPPVVTDLEPLLIQFIQGTSKKGFDCLKNIGSVETLAVSED